MDRLLVRKTIKEMISDIAVIGMLTFIVICAIATIVKDEV
tara:strand:+ start:1930 stop:2049 length:120 start_codon:yes stop_codon:yes gene_type:complete